MRPHHSLKQIRSAAIGLVGLVTIICSACTERASLGAIASSPDVVFADAGTCDQLAPPGQWENITPAELVLHPSYSGALLPLVNPQDPTIVYLTTDSNGLFKTLTCGSRWDKVNTGLNGDHLNGGRMWTAALDPQSPDTIYTATSFGTPGVWKTTNAGLDWTQLFASGSDILTATGGFVERISMDPDAPSHLLVNFVTSCAAPHAAVCFAETADGGATWSVVDVPASVIVSPPITGSGIIVIHRDIWLYGEPFGGLFRTSDHGASWANVTAPTTGGASFPGVATAFRASDGTYYLGSLQGVIRSSDNASWSLIPNSGYGLTPVWGDDLTLYAGVQWPTGAEYIFTAPYTDLSHWTGVVVPGTASAASGQGMWGFGYDPSRHLLYATSQSQGMWRVVTH